jgi:hypothetical protein
VPIAVSPSAEGDFYPGDLLIAACDCGQVEALAMVIRPTDIDDASRVDLAAFIGY